MQSVMQHQFGQLPAVQIPRSTFDRSHGYKTTFDAGKLIPFFVDEALPGDTFNLNASIFARLATPLKPLMDNMVLDTHFFSCPVRLVWENFVKFNGEQKTPGDSTDFLVPQMTIPAGSDALLGTMHDYFGLPTHSAGDYEVNSLWHRAAHLIWNEWFRDQNLQDPVVVDTDDGPDNHTDYSALLPRAKRPDYFTTCLPWPQKGDDVMLPLAGTAPIENQFGDRRIQLGVGLGDDVVTDQYWLENTQGTQTIKLSGNAAAGSPHTKLVMFADMSQVTANTINALREAVQLQRMYERDARGGTRYADIIRSHFGVLDPMNAVLQRPEFLGGGSSYVNLHPVAQTSEENNTPQGNLAAFGTVSGDNHGFTKSFTEHCLIIGFVSVRADLTYQQGINRMFTRRTRFDYYWPSLAHLGEQEVLNKEIYTQGNATDELVFGYQERYAEYRYKPSQITGLFRSTATTPLDMWHLSQEFGSLPTLNSSFIQENPPIDRVIAVPSEPHFIFDAFIRLKCARPMPVYGVPGMLDRF